jgi:multiple sugar transport system permease protein
MIRTQATAPRPRSDRRRAEPYVYLGPSLLLTLLVMLVPLILGVGYSFQHLVVYDPLGEGGFVGLANYRQMLADPQFWGALGNTLKWTVSSLVMQILLGLGLALLLRVPFRGRGLYQALVFLPWAVPAFLSGFAWKWLYDPAIGPFSPALLRSGWIQEPLNILGDPATALWGAVAANVWFGVPFFAITLLAALQSIPGDQYEAADIDGAGRWAKFTYITLPWLRPTLLITVLLRTIWIANFTDLIWVMTGGGPAGSSHILSSYIFSTVFQKLDFGYGAALSTALLLLLLVYAAVLGRARRGLS